MLFSRWLVAVLAFVERIIGGKFFESLQQSRTAVLGSINQLKNQQEQALAKLLQEAKRDVPFYRERVRAHQGEQATDYLQQFPLLNKSALNRYTDALQSQRRQGKKTKLLTSGSSGTQGFVYVNESELATNRALQILWWEWAGYNLGDKVLQLGFDAKRSRLKQLKDVVLNTDYYFAKDLDEGKIQEILKKYQNKKGVVFFGYAAYLNWFAATALKYQIDNIEFKTIISCGDKLFETYREQIRLAFGGEVFDTYGASEGFLLAAQRKCGHYHTYPHHLYIEILNDAGNPVPHGTVGHVYVTCLTTSSMPLIRYKLGDLAAISDFEPCSCGLNTPKITSLIGRETDSIIGENGGMFTVQDLVYALKNISGIDGYQLQYNPANIFNLIYWPKVLPTALFEPLRQELENRLHKNIQFSATYSPSPPKFTGKVQLIKQV